MPKLQTLHTHKINLILRLHSPPSPTARVAWSHWQTAKPYHKINLIHRFPPPLPRGSLGSHWQTAKPCHKLKLDSEASLCPPPHLAGRFARIDQQLILLHLYLQFKSHWYLICISGSNLFHLYRLIKRFDCHMDPCHLHPIISWPFYLSSLQRFHHQFFHQKFLYISNRRVGKGFFMASIHNIFHNVDSNNLLNMSNIPYSNSFDILHQISIRQEVHHQYILSSIRFERRHRKFNLQEEH